MRRGITASLLGIEPSPTDDAKCEGDSAEPLGKSQMTVIIFHGRKSALARFFTHHICTSTTDFVESTTTRV